MTDSTEPLRRSQWARLNAAPASRDVLAAEHGQVWDTEELVQDFEVLGFLAPYCVVRRRADNQLGSLAFQHDPRLYFAWVPDPR